MNPGPPGMPPLPQGWIAQYDYASKRYYYAEQATGRTQWEPPTISAMSYPGDPSGYYGAAAGKAAPGALPGAGLGAAAAAGQKGANAHKAKKPMNTLLAGAGGLAIGAIGGAMLEHAWGKSNYTICAWTKR